MKIMDIKHLIQNRVVEITLVVGLGAISILGTVGIVILALK